MASQINVGAFPIAGQSTNIWQKALSNLDDDLKTILNFRSSSKRDILTAVLEAATEKRQLCLDKRWRFKKSNGEQIILRDLMEKIIVWLEKFKDIGDIVIQYDPSHASLPWAGVRFLLQLAISDKQVFGAMTEGLEMISHLIPRYAIFEALYLRHSSTVRGKLESALTNLYAEALTFLAKAKKYFQTPTAFRIAQSAFISEERRQIQKIVESEEKVSKLVQLADAENQQNIGTDIVAVRAILEDLRKPIARLLDLEASNIKAVEENRRLEILRWLSLIPFRKHHERHSENRIPSSGQWLLCHDQYLDWKSSSSSSILLLHGILGSGKTSLASVIIDSYLDDNKFQTSPVPLAYFYCTDNSFEVERANSEEIMRSIVRQLAFLGGSQNEVYSALINEYERRATEARLEGFDISKLGVSECIDVILEITALSPATIILDAIDEIEENCRHKLIEALLTITKDSTSVVKVFVTSRNNNNIFALLPNSSRICIHDYDNRADMHTFVRQSIEIVVHNRKLLSGEISDDLKEKLIQALIDGAGEMFIWVTLQIECLCRKKLEIDVKMAMERLTEDKLNQLYAATFNTVFEENTFSCMIARYAFFWLLCMREPLSSEAFLAAVGMSVSGESIKLGVDDLVNICCNMVVLDSKLNVFRFSHISVQDYLQDKPEFSREEAHNIAAIACLRSCMQGCIMSIEQRLFPIKYLHQYAAIYWADHCRLAGVNDNNDELFKVMSEFIFDEDEISLSFMNWLHDASEIHRSLPREHSQKKVLAAVTNSNASPLFTACIFGFHHLIKAMSYSKDIDWEQKNDSGHSSIYLASTFGHEAIVRTLIEYGVDVNATGGKYSSPLYAACFAGHGPTVKLLLDNGADLRATGVFHNALHASFLGDQEEVALILLDNGFEIANQQEYELILGHAAQVGFGHVIDSLQRIYAAKFTISFPPRRKAVETAIVKGRLDILKRFLQNSSNPEHVLPTDGLSMAALGGYHSMVSLLLKAGLDIEQEGPFGTPLRTASLMGHEFFVRTLLDKGAQVDNCGSFSHALQAAAMKGHVLIMQILIKHGADVNHDGGYYGNALQAAAYRGHKKAVEVLLDLGARIHQKGITKDVFHAAADGGHEEIIRLLLDRGYKPLRPLFRPCYLIAPSSKVKILFREASPTRAKDKKAHTKPPKTAGWNECTATSDQDSVLKALSGDIDPIASHDVHPYQMNLEDKNYAFEAAASKGHYSVINLIIDFWKTLRISNHELGNALKEASKNGHTAVVKIIIDRNLDISPHLKAALHISALNGHLSITSMLLEHHNRNQQNQRFDFESERIALIAASEGGHLAIATKALDLMLQHCSVVEMSAIYSEALYEATKHDSVVVMKLLLQAKSSLEKDELLKLFNIACDCGHKEAAMCLIEHDTRDILGFPEYQDGFHRAVRSGSSELISLFVGLSHGQNDFVISMEEFAEACQKGSTEFVRLLVGKLEIDNSKPDMVNVALINAAHYGNLPVVEFLVQEGGDVNAVVDEFPGQSSKPITALQAAIREYCRHKTTTRWHPIKDHIVDLTAQEATIRRLLENGADISASTPLSNKILRNAIEYLPTELAQSIITKGNKLDWSIKDSTLEFAANQELNSVSVISTLFETGARIPTCAPGENPVLNAALTIFGRIDAAKDCYADELYTSRSIKDIIFDGAGGAVKILLAKLPDEKAHGPHYSLILQMAAVVGDYDFVRLLIERNINVNAVGHYYGSALQGAARMGHKGIVNQLLEAGADVNILQGKYGTALRAAVFGGHSEIVGLLIKSGADINLTLSKTHTSSLKSRPILNLAAEARNLDIFKMLLGAHADINLDHPDHPYFLITACSFDDMDIIRYLLENKAMVNPSRKPSQHLYQYSGEKASPLHAASAKGHESVIDVLLEYGADFDKEFEKCGTPLQVAALAGHLPIVQRLLRAGASVDENACGTALANASFNGHIDVVRELLRAGACIEVTGRLPNALEAACKHSQTFVVKLLLEELSGTESMTKVYNDAMAAACFADDDQILQLLIKHCPHPSLVILKKACATGLGGTVRALLNSGIDPNDGDDEEGRLLEIAAYNLNFNIVRLLISHGAQIHFQSKTYGGPLAAALEGLAIPSLRQYCGAQYGKTFPIIGRYALSDKPRPNEPQLNDPRPSGPLSDSEYGYQDCRNIVRALICNGAEVNTELREFGNALHLASLVGDESIVQLLLENGADINSCGGYFGTALLAALRGNHPTVVEILLRWGSNVNYSSPSHGTPLYFACLYCTKSTVVKLLQHGADLNASGGQHGSPLAAAVSRQDLWYRNDDHGGIADFLLQFGENLRIQQCDILAVAKQRWTPEKDYLKLFLAHDKSIQISESVIVAAIPNGGSDRLQLLFERYKGSGVTEAMLKAAHNQEVMTFLLQQQVICPITSSIVEDFVADEDFPEKERREVLQLLINRDPDIVVDEAIIIAALNTISYHPRQIPSNENLIQLLFKRNTQLQTTEAMLKAAGDPEDLKVLLKNAPQMHITEDILETFGSYWDDEELVEILLAHNQSIKISNK